MPPNPNVQCAFLHIYIYHVYDIPEPDQTEPRINHLDIEEMRSSYVFNELSLLVVFILPISAHHR